MKKEEITKGERKKKKGELEKRDIHLKERSAVLTDGLCVTMLMGGRSTFFFTVTPSTTSIFWRFAGPTAETLSPPLRMTTDIFCARRFASPRVAPRPPPALFVILCERASERAKERRQALLASACSGGFGRSVTG